MYLLERGANKGAEKTFLKTYVKDFYAWRRRDVYWS